MKTKINLATPWVGLDGSKSQNTMGREIAPLMGMDTKGDPLKMDAWARDLYNEKTLELDESDTQLFKAWVRGQEQIFAILKAQILRVIAAAEVSGDQKAD